MRAPVALALAALLASVAALPAPPAAAQGVFGGITGPNALAPRQAAQYNVTVTGGPPGEVNYTLEFFLDGTDLTGGAPRETSPGRTTGNQTLFRIDVTAPESEQTVTLVVKVSARASGLEQNTTLEKSILVLVPIVLQATFRNGSPTAAVNVTVRFYVDDVFVGTRTIARIDATGQATVSFNYLPVGLRPGAHRLRIEADLDGDGRIDPSRGEVVVSEIFYQETPPLSQGWSLVLAIVVFIAAFFLTVAWRRRKQTA